MSCACGKGCSLGCAWGEPVVDAKIKVNDPPAIMFQVQGADGMHEMMRFDANGDVFVRGEKVDSNPEVYKTFLEWFAQTRKVPL